MSQKAGIAADSPATRDGVEVQDLGQDRYRVTGRSASIEELALSVNFVGELAPDATDGLRGFKVARIEVTPV